MPPKPGIALITEIHRAVHAIGLRIADEFDITQAEALVLVLLHPTGSAPLEDVHSTFLHRRSTLTSVLQRLTERGLVERLVDAKDRRRYHIRLTSSGKKKAAQIDELFSALVAGSKAGHKELAAAQRTLMKIVGAATGQSDSA